jgi:hypothetical protein
MRRPRRVVAGAGWSGCAALSGAQAVWSAVRRIDEEEDEPYGEARGDELPEHLRTREGRRKAFREAKRRLAEKRGAVRSKLLSMRRVLSTELGQQLYRKRQALVEPRFADLKFNRKADRFQPAPHHTTSSPDDPRGPRECRATEIYPTATASRGSEPLGRWISVELTADVLLNAAIPQLQ